MRCLVWLALLPVLMTAVVLLAVCESSPLVRRGEAILPDSVAEARRLLTSNDPRRLRRGEERTASIPATLVDTLIDHLASRRWRGRGEFQLGENAAEVRVTVPIESVPLPCYVNLTVVVQAMAGEPRVLRASIGRLRIPPALAELLIASTIRSSGYAPQWQAARQAIRRLVFAPELASVELTYVWEPGLLDNARAVAFTSEDIHRMQRAQTELAVLLDHYTPRVAVPLGRILAPLLANSGNPTPAEGRAALFVLATYLAEASLANLLPEANSWPRPRRVKLTLRGRYDSAQHFGISAALAAWVGEPAADAIGLYKEIEDSRGGSGFSFADLAADRAGTRFGELVIGASPRLYTALAEPLSDGDLVGSFDGLPESLSESEFARRFGGMDSRAYRELTDEVERRLAALPLYR
ncbi:MAG TPA: hypothetical protein PLO14_10085 [Accumulibacter sp.]|uniref:hypothetical protein n=1 Tax=Accumulibacter sp. TaxID=2053492 RepID=UPI0025F6F0A4|nr:hypothetical protein [Accumulibacter sp.]MCM8598311.1 hypothetical protein [Accumulibacter sp.]MCM8662652.1 hypothetical protein [Accumulibacter sp.]HNC52571.1 hypothetical protein [Accumulibacter sp.]